MVVNGPWLFYRGLRYLELVSRLVGNFLRKVITIRLLEAIVGIYWIKERGYFILFDNFDYYVECIWKEY